MTSPTIVHDGDVRYQRVSRRVARQTWLTGEPVILCPCKLYPFGCFRPSIMIQRDIKDETERRAYGLPVNTFDTVVRGFISYNCSYETGYYPSYWVQS